MSVRGYTGSKASFFAKRQHRKQTLSVVVCGPSGTGKTAFINTFLGRRVHEAPHITTETDLRMVPVTEELDEPLDDGSKLVLTLIDCENFATSLVHGDDVEQLAYYIECRFDEVLAEESRIRRNPKFKDGRVDACIYFIEPTGHGLREIDILTLRRLVPIVNVIPVLARADTLTPAERVAMKRMVLEDLRMHDINVFDFRYEGDEDEAVPDPEITEALPLAITTSSEFDADGSVVYRRNLSYGVVDILNPEHSDFALLRDALVHTHRQDLKERTHEVLYETYRTNRLDPHRNHRSSLLLPQELAGHAARLKEAQLARESENLKEEERRINAELEAKRNLLLRRERELRELEMRMAEVRPQYPAAQDNVAEQRIRQSRSKRELKEHADQLHAEVASLEAHKQDLQERQLATAASSRSIAGQGQSENHTAAGGSAAAGSATYGSSAAVGNAPNGVSVPNVPNVNVPSSSKLNTSAPNSATEPDLDIPARTSSPFAADVPGHAQTAAPPGAGTPKDLNPRHNPSHVASGPTGSAVDLGDFVDVPEEPSVQSIDPSVPQPGAHISTISEESLSFVQNTSPLQIKKMSTANSDY